MSTHATPPQSRTAAAPRPGAPRPRLARLVLPGLALAAAVVNGTGCSCIPKPCKSVPAYRLPDLHCVVDRGAMCPVDISLLGRKPPKAHIIGPGDTLSVYVYGVLPPNQEDAPVVAPTGAINQEYYPPLGQADLPALGVPVRVEANGTVSMPELGSLDVNGLTAEQAREKILDGYLEEEILAEGQDRVAVSVLKVRTYRVNVVREDVATPEPIFQERGQVILAKRGRAQVVDLPAFQNDVLHALTHSGGLPGKDAENAVWVLRAGEGGDAAPALATLQQMDDPARLLNEENTPGLGHRATKIPLRLLPGEPAPFRLEDVVLNDGDTIFVPARDEVFYVGGLLAGGQYPYPPRQDAGRGRSHRPDRRVGRRPGRGRRCRPGGHRPRQRDPAQPGDRAPQAAGRPATLHPRGPLPRPARRGREYPHPPGRRAATLLHPAPGRGEQHPEPVQLHVRPRQQLSGMA